MIAIYEVKSGSSYKSRMFGNDAVNAYVVTCFANAHLLFDEMPEKQYYMEYNDHKVFKVREYQ